MPGTAARAVGRILVTIVSALAGTPAAAGDAVLVREFVYDAAPYPEAHASTIVETRDGNLAAAWFGGTRERNPDVSIWFARHEGGRWQTPVRVADGVQADGTRQPTWNPVLFQDPAGDLLLFYKVGPTPRDWWGMVMRSDDGGRSWGPPRRLPDGILGPIKNKPVILADGAWLAPSSVEQVVGVLAGEGAPSWRIHFERSADRGRTWSRTPPVASPFLIDAIQPSILFHGDGVLQAIARSRQGAMATSWSYDDGRTWSDIAALALPDPNSGADALTLADGRHLVVYNHAAHDPRTPGKGPRHPLVVALSDDGIAWRRALTLEQAPLEHGYAYPAVIQAGDGRVHVTYTHDRHRIRHVVLDPRRLE
ncbi:sialidase family protein [Coralloluteibacterium stylophorae]|uniref:Exo-alpha-sialidase n=1 Tax=Coralloluteibacterium stylophorae TaxID=1776034 RepID=A0A8J8AW14_9GAMM|nr:sialidase family protein [Coralloluteibacterium stylophorae]MBS7456912.1 exo-alpha-sialidase [Coralloluteibacterium stylophorae]